jgi:hypothetical protein
MAEDNRRYQSSEEMALSRMGSTLPGPLPNDHVGSAGQIIRGVVSGDQAAQIQRDISATMAGLIGDLRRGGDPLTAGGRLPSVRPASAAPVHGAPIRGTGWREAAPLQSNANRTANAIMDGIAHAMAPHGSGNPEHRGPKKAEEK